MNESKDNEDPARRFIEKLVSNPTFYDGDPDKGGKPIKYTGSKGWWEASKSFREYVEERGSSIIPAHDYELLKEHRRKKYEEELTEFTEERRNNDFSNTPIDIARFRLLWLQDELTRNVESWLSPTYPNGESKRRHRLSDIIEQQKYKDYILAEIKALEAQIQASNEQTAPLVTAESANDESKTHKVVINSGFETYLVEEHRARLMPYLIKNYTSLEPRFYAYMVGALIELQIVPMSTRHSNKKAVHRALTQSFNVIFPAQSWNVAINRLDTVHSDEDKRNVNEHAGKIRAFLRADRPD